MRIPLVTRFLERRRLRKSADAYSKAAEAWLRVMAFHPRGSARWKYALANANRCAMAAFNIASQYRLSE